MTPDLDRCPTCGLPRPRPGSLVTGRTLDDQDAEYIHWLELRVLASRLPGASPDDDVALFLEECTRDTLDPREFTPARMLFEAFSRWAERNKHRGMASNKFGRRMTTLGRPSQHTERGNRYPVAVTDEL